MKYKVTNKIEMLNEEFDLEEYNMTNDDYVNDYIDAESEEEAIRTAMDYLSEQIQNNGFEVEFNKEEKEMTVYKDDEPLEKWNNFRAEEQVRDIDIENVDIFFVQNDEFVEMYYNPDATAGGQVVYNTIPYELVHQATEQATNQESVVKDFFEHLDTGCKQYLIDKGTPEFEDACKELIEGANEIAGKPEGVKQGIDGRWFGTMEKMQKYAFSQILCDRAEAEQQAYIRDLREKSPDVIIDLSYRKAVRDELLCTLKETDLSVNQLKNLLKHEYPLEACYNEWIKNDLSMKEVLEVSVHNCADKEFQEEVQQESAIEDMEM